MEVRLLYIRSNNEIRTFVCLADAFENIKAGFSDTMTYRKFIRATSAKRFYKEAQIKCQIWGVRETLVMK